MTSESNQRDDQGKVHQGKPTEGDKREAEAAASAAEGEPTQERLAQLAAEVDEFKDRYMRSVAEMENLRRRFEREKGELLKFGQEGLFKDCLPALDSLERALPDDAPRPADIDAQTASYLDGMGLVKRQILDTFRKHGLEGIEAKGLPFDPHLHQAVQRIDSEDVVVETVKDEFAKGYLLNGRLLRPAMVSVLIPISG